ncbi:MAG: spore cortex biosynthesis protein YabQ [Oscillospiraceae bacterium]|jgi:hypothetical protein|nr:spore cortex biosynthesis protein YabQ [Oscillospiraceae bacterium]
MEIYVTSQAVEALYAFGFGAIAGVLYDFFAVLRRSARFAVSRAMLAAIFDFLFCAVCGAGFFMLGYGPGNGRLRLLSLLFALPGTTLYFILLSRIVTYLLNALLKLVCRIVRLILTPFRMSVRGVRKFVKFSKNSLRYRMKYVNIGIDYSVNIIERKENDAQAKVKAKHNRGGGDNNRADIRDPVASADTGKRAKGKRRRSSDRRKA